MKYTHKSILFVGLLILTGVALFFGKTEVVDSLLTAIVAIAIFVDTEECE